MSVITIERKVLEKNDELARQNRALLERHGIFAINVVSSPGAGKTSLLERTLEHLAGKLAVAVIEGDVQTDRDARRIESLGVPVVQVVTNGTCHLDAQMVQGALGHLEIGKVELLFIENVGNLVCPASYDLGEHLRIVLASTTEGEDKPLKYPVMFRHADLVVLTKTDLLPHLDDVSTKELRDALARVMPRPRAIELSVKRGGAGLAEWIEWLESQRIATIGAPSESPAHAR